MKKILVVILLAFIEGSIGYCQELTIKSFSLAESDLTAQTQPRRDLNDKNCALVKIQFVGEIAEVEGNVIMPLVRHTNETWIYMPQNSRQLKVITQNYLPVMVTFTDWGIEKLESNRTYALVLSRNDRAVASLEVASRAKQNSSASSSNSTITIPVKDGISIEMVRVEAGTFMMGASKEIKIANSDGKPAHLVTLTRDYYIGKYEVTQALWKAVMGSNPSKFKSEKRPVETVSWDDCQDFIIKLNQMTGRTFRLPTEAEWEYAARGGKQSKDYLYSGSNNPSDVAWYSEKYTHPVGNKLPNELGIYDMSGNVWEWVQDNYSKYNKLPTINPLNEESHLTGHSFRVSRGGGWYFGNSSCRVFLRGRSLSNDKTDNQGFRLALTD